MDEAAQTVAEGTRSSPSPPACLPPDDTTLSKNARKKLLKAAHYEEQKLVRRQKEKERKRARKEEAIAAGTWVPSLSAQRRRNGIQPGEQIPIAATLVIDLGFDALMTEREILSMTQQLSLLYSSNKYAPRPFAKVLFCGQGRWDPRALLPKQTEEVEAKGDQEQTLFDSRLGQRMEGKMGGTWRRWTDVVLCNRGGLKHGGSSADDSVATLSGVLASTTVQEDVSAASLLPSRDKIVYLTADTDATLEAVEEGHAYIIGGLVDRNRYPSICAEKARRLGFKTARLPISAERLRSSAVMTVNHVVQILLTFNETHSWDVALDKHLPLRKRRGHGEDQGDKAEQPAESVLVRDYTKATPMPRDS